MTCGENVRSGSRSETMIAAVKIPDCRFFEWRVPATILTGRNKIKVPLRVGAQPSAGLEMRGPS